MLQNPSLITILGPTASGKSSLAISLARELGTEIISADSRTIYREMNIGTAKPIGRKNTASEIDRDKISAQGIHAKNITLTDLFTEKPFISEGIIHWGIDIIDPDESYSASQFKDYAEKHIDHCHANEKIPLLVGGTGLYISGIVNQLSFSEVAPDEVLRRELSEMSNDDLINLLTELDSEALDIIDTSNRRRLERAIEVIKITGKKWAEQASKNPSKYNTLQIGLTHDREVLYHRIDERVDIMIADGLIEEARQLHKKYGSEAPGMNTIGYKQLCAFFDGYITLNDAIDLIKRDTRHYAKRQITWFKRDKSINWINKYEEAHALIENFLK